MKASKSKKRVAAKRVGRNAKAKGRAGKARPIAAAPKPARRAAAASVARRTAPAGSAASREVELEAAVLRRLLRHFDERKDVQNIELMILAGFCRNCLSKWFVEAALERGIEVDIERAREKIYGMPYSEWKERHQEPATDDQLRRFREAERRKLDAGLGAESLPKDAGKNQ
jgi:uncharacterized protein